MPGQLYLDLDGVLADFDAGAERMLGTDNSYKYEWVHGSDVFWDGLNADPQFFYHLPQLPDAMDLWQAVRFRNPVILTALPKVDATDVAGQKRSWVAENLGVDVDVITCMTSDKPHYSRPGAVLVDDRTVNRAEWVRCGGIFVHHTSALSTINQLMQIGVL